MTVFVSLADVTYLLLDSSIERIVRWQILTVLFMQLATFLFLHHNKWEGLFQKC